MSYYLKPQQTVSLMSQTVFQMHMNKIVFSLQIQLVHETTIVLGILTASAK